MAVNMLLSFAFDDTRRFLREYRAAMPCGRLMIDSGAYTAFTTGKQVNLADYAAFLTDHLGCWDTAVTLDVIGDPAATRRNTRILHDKGLPVMPVFTRGGSVADFDAMVRDSKYVCVGGGVGMSRQVVVRRCRALQVRAEELGGGIHTLGVGSVTLLRQIRPYSADSSKISQAFQFGSVVSWNGRVMTTVPLTDTRKLRAHLVHLRAAGLELSDLARTGRLPNGPARQTLMQGTSLGHCCADEVVNRFRVPVPVGVDDTPGTHLFSAVTGSHLARGVVELDRLLHDPRWTPPPMWGKYRAGHANQCRVNRSPATVGKVAS